MPFESQAQRRFLFAKHPKVAKEFASKTPPNANLPARKSQPKKGMLRPSRKR